MKTLGLDLSSVATGWSVFEEDGLVASGVINPPKSTLSEAAKFFYIAHSVAGLIKMYRPTDISVEDTFFAKDPTVLKKLNRIAGQIQYLWFSYSGKNVNFYMASTVRKSFPGLTGKSKKEEIVSAVNKEFHMRTKDHNIADAIVVGCHHVMLELGKEMNDSKGFIARVKEGGKSRVRPKRHHRRT
ncbi:MAG: hypothetical protein E2O29_01525 [Deltaproteobacteria bacterium]|nr:MAG: hypothetical protein E2O29_01525 [Deltaproteobacteria bacterium]